MYVHQGDTGKSGHGRGDFAVRDAPLASILRKEGGEGGERRGRGDGRSVWKKALETNFEGIRPLYSIPWFHTMNRMEKSETEIG